MSNIVWIIQGYEKESNERLEDVVVFEVFADNEEKAIQKAKNIMKKKYYRIQRIIEKEENG